LRTIGQALEALHLKVFDLLNKERYYLVRGGTGTSSSMDIVVRYTLEDIDQLDREAKARRRHLHGMPDLYSLSHMLRVVGSIVDHRGGRLLEVSRQGPWVTIQYETEHGRKKKERRPDSSIYDLCLRMYLHRERLRRFLLK
jgi:hypothetical protein